MALPLIDFGVAQGLIYFLPKYQNNRNNIISQFFNLQILASLFFLIFCIFFEEKIALLFTSNTDIGQFIPYIGVFLVIWALSNNLEILLTVEKKSLYASFFIFLSEGLKGAIVIVIALIYGSLTLVLVGFIAVGTFRLIWLFIHVIRERQYNIFFFQKKLTLELVKYSAPLGVAMLINSLIDYSHQVIVSSQLSAADFAIYSIGCFQVPFIGIVSMSVSRVAMVKITELLTNNENKKVVEILSNSFRKLAMLFFPAFIILYAVASDFVSILYTDAYSESVPIFRIFIWILPLAAILVEYAPRSLGDSVYVFKVNCITLILNIIIVIILLKILGIAGAAAGFIISRAARKWFILLYLKKNLNTYWKDLVPFRSLISIFFLSLMSLGPTLILKKIIPMSQIGTLVCQCLVYLVCCSIVFWIGGVLGKDEKIIIKKSFHSIISKMGFFSY